QHAPIDQFCVAYVNVVEAWPARRLTASMFAPEAIHNATAVCLRSCGRSGASPDALTAGFQNRLRHELTRIGPPAGAAYTRSSVENRAMWSTSSSMMGAGNVTERRPARVFGAPHSSRP